MSRDREETERTTAMSDESHESRGDDPRRPGEPPESGSEPNAVEKEGLDLSWWEETQVRDEPGAGPAAAETAEPEAPTPEEAPVWPEIARRAGSAEATPLKPAPPEPAAPETERVEAPPRPVSSPPPPAPTPEPVDEPPEEESPAEPAEPTIAERLEQAREASRLRREQEERQVRRDFQRVVEDVKSHLAKGYDLLGLAGYSGSGKTHFLRALSLLLKKQGFEVADWERMRRSRVPGLSEATVYDYPVSGPNDEKWVFVDAGGELYARLRLNDWELADDSAALLHSLYHCRGLFLLLHLQPGHFRLGSAGIHRWMSEEERQRDAEVQAAQEELEFFDHLLLFLRALQAEDGKVETLVVRCSEAGTLDKALRPYRDDSPKLNLPVQVLFTQADTFGDGRFEVAEAVHLSPRKSTVGVASFVARRLPMLFGTLLQHARRFRFDFVQSYEENQVEAPDGTRQTIPEWALDDELLSCGALPALEFLVRNLPAEGRWERLLRRFELGTRGALELDRLLHPGRWKGVEVKL